MSTPQPNRFTRAEPSHTGHSEFETFRRADGWYWADWPNGAEHGPFVSAESAERHGHECLEPANDLRVETLNYSVYGADDGSYRILRKRDRSSGYVTGPDAEDFSENLWHWRIVEGWTETGAQRVAILWLLDNYLDRFESLLREPPR